jgi:hypothetical protein
VAKEKEKSLFKYRHNKRSKYSECSEYGYDRRLMLALLEGK